MPLNKLDNFIKNTEGRILYVNPSDLDATDAITNQGNSLAQPFKTIQRALIEAARFSYVRGSNNDIVEKTTILLFPGIHTIDNRPGFAIKNDGGTAKAVAPAGAESIASEVLSLSLTSNFDLTQEDNILYKFNSIYGGVVVPRGTSIVGLDLRKTKIKPKYVPNPTDSTVGKSAIFRITGACYFWQFSIFDGDEASLVYTDDSDFSTLNQSTPRFSHHKLTCFEYADGVSIPTGYEITDLDMYYSKVGNAFNTASGRDIDQKYPTQVLGFNKRRPEWEIVGAFASDPVNITSVVCGDGITPTSIVTVTTAIPHNLTEDTPIKINGVKVSDYNISTKVQNVLSSTQFTYLLPFIRNNLPATPSASGAKVVIETDTVGGASPYVFNVSLRSVWGMNGMHTDGAKASGFRSMVVAQFTGISLQKDDRAFVKYNKSSRSYEGISVSKVTGAALVSGSTSTNEQSAYHLDPDAIYRDGWESTHIKMSNDGFVQIVSVFGVGFTVHFDSISGGDGSITNSNSNFGQLSTRAKGFKKDAFLKDDTAYITSIVAPRAIVEEETNIDWISIDVGLTTSVAQSSQLYLFGFTSEDDNPPNILQGYRVGARENDKLYVNIGSGTSEALIYMCDTFDGTLATGTNSAKKEYDVIAAPSNNILTFGVAHALKTGETVKLFSADGDFPENINERTIYYAIANDVDGTLTSSQIKLATSENNALLDSPITIYGGTNLKIRSTVSEKNSGDVGHPVQYDTVNKNWFIHVKPNNQIYNALAANGVANLTERTDVSFIKRTPDPRSLDEKIYKLRVVVPKENTNARDPVESYVIQESSSTSVRSNLDFTLASIGSTDHEYNRNPRFISSCTAVSNTITVISELPHDLKVGENIIIKNVTSSTNTAGTDNIGFNGTFSVASVVNPLEFTCSTTDVDGIVHSPGTFTNNTNVRSTSLPRFERNDLKSNYLIYRSDVINPYIEGTQDGVYYLYVLNADNAIPTEFTSKKYAQRITDLYPQLDRDNIEDNPPSTKSFAKRYPVGDVSTSDLKHSITRETTDKVLKDFGRALDVASVTDLTTSALITFNSDHGLSGIVTYSSLTGGTGHNNGTYYNVRLYNNAALTAWDGATAKVVVSGGAVTGIDIQEGGSGYLNGETLYIDTNKIGGAANATITIATSGISTNVGDVIQFTGTASTSDCYHRILSIPSKIQVSVAKTVGDTLPTANQYGIIVGPTVVVSSTTYNSTTGISTINCSGPHGLLAGSRFRALDTNNNKLGDFIVNSKVDFNSFTAVTNASISPKYILKHGLSANEAVADVTAENIGTRDLFFYENETLSAVSFTSDTQIRVSSTVSGISTTQRFPLGSYVQIDNEIMRVASSTLSGSSNDEITVLRGVLGTKKVTHENGSLIRKIKVLPIEFRRPSILRASGHTFEYLGFGPGNYSTSLPQVQVRTLSETEEFLSQSQQESCGSVVYSGMNNNGDFYIGNKKLSSLTGKETVFGAPIPTITGEDVKRLSVVFDEVTVKERILVEGGNSGTVLSEFGGPVTFNKELKMNDAVKINGLLKVNNTVEITNTTQSTSKDTGALVIDGGVGIEKNLYAGGLASIAGACSIGGNATIGGTTQSTTKDTGSLIIEGGVGIEKNLNIGGDFTVGGTTQSTSKDTGALIIEGGAGIEKNLYVGGNLNVGGTATITGNVAAAGNFRFGDNDHLYFGDGDDLDLYHDGSNSYVDDTGTGSLFLRGNGGVYIQKYTGESLIDAVADGAVNLYHDNTVRFNTRSDGARVTGEFSATGDVIAFVSDERLKTNIQPLESALDKVLQLSGFTYTFNETAGSLGFNTEETHVGVSAQQVQAVLPEAVKPAPVSGDYITVQYEKIVPLLIEAIKELSAKVDALEEKLG